VRISAVIFDLDNTLYDERQFVKSGFRAVSRLLAEKYSIDEEKSYRLLFEIFSKRGRERVFDQTLREFGIYKKGIVLEMVGVYRNHYPKITIFRDAAEVLPKIKKEYKIALVTGGTKKVQENKIEALKLKGFFDVITYAIECGGKNSVKTFSQTVERLEVNPARSMYVDDNPLNGFVAAKELGIHTAVILRGKNKIILVDKGCKPDVEVKNFRQLLNVIRRNSKARLT
jgi:putative hydrolase of the HAD superfamily